MRFSVKRGDPRFIVVDKAGAPLQGARILSATTPFDENVALHELTTDRATLVTFAIEVDGVRYDGVPYYEE